MPDIAYHSIVIANKRFRMAEGSAQVTNYQLVLDKCTANEKEQIYKEACKIRNQYTDPVEKTLINLIMLGCLKT